MKGGKIGYSHTVKSLQKDFLVYLEMPRRKGLKSQYNEEIKRHAQMMNGIRFDSFDNYSLGGEDTHSLDVRSTIKELKYRLNEGL